MTKQGKGVCLESWLLANCQPQKIDSLENVLFKVTNFLQRNVKYGLAFICGANIFTTSPTTMGNALKSLLRVQRIMFGGFINPNVYTTKVSRLVHFHQQGNGVYFRIWVGLGILNAFYRISIWILSYYNQLDDHWILLFLNHLTILDLEPRMNLIGSMIAIIFPYFQYRLYPSRKTLKHFGVVNYVRRYAQWIHSHKCLDSSLTKRLCRLELYYKVLIFFFYEALAMFVAVNTLLTLYVTVRHQDYFLQFNLIGGARLAFLWFNSLHYVYVMLMVVKTYTDFFNINLFFSLFVFSDLKRATQMLSRMRNLSKARFDRFTTLHNTSARRIFTFNYLFGPTLLVYYLVNFPTNAFLVALVITRSLPLVLYVFLVFFMLHQYLFIFFIHLVAISYTKRIHSFVKTAYGSMFTSPGRRGQTLCRIRMFNYISHFNNGNFYGLSYGSLGRISFFVFSKAIFVYVKFIFYYYAHMRVH